MENQYENLAVNTIVKNKNVEVNSCDILFSENLQVFNSHYLKDTEMVAENDLIKEGITNYDKGIINVVLGSKDYSVRETKSIVEEHELRLKVNVIKGADHNFKGKLKLFMELPAQIFFEKN